MVSDMADDECPVCMVLDEMYAMPRRNPHMAFEYSGPALRHPKYS
jgi:hypothetical protein